MYSIFEKLLNEKGVTAYQVSKSTGISTGSLSDWKNGRSNPKIDKMQKIAEYFGVSVDYLLTGEEPPKTEKAPTLNKKDERDIARQLEAMLGEMESSYNGALMFDGEPLDDETRELLRISLKNQLELSKQIAKQKYTPKKYRKN